MVASDGGVFAFGDADYVGSVPASGIGPVGSKSHHPRPIVGIVPSPDGKGYLLVASDGGVFAFGDAHFVGSCGSIGGCPAPVVAVVPDATGRGYWLLLSNCEMVAFGDAPRIPDVDCQNIAHAHKVVATAAARTPGGTGTGCCSPMARLIRRGQTPGPRHLERAATAKAAMTRPWPSSRRATARGLGHKCERHSRGLRRHAKAGGRGREAPVRSDHRRRGLVALPTNGARMKVGELVSAEAAARLSCSHALAMGKRTRGRIDRSTMTSTVLVGNPLGDPAVRPLWVYLPPGYDDDPGRRYPSSMCSRATPVTSPCGPTGALTVCPTPRPRTSCSPRAGRPPASSFSSTPGRRTAAPSSSTHRARAGTTPTCATRWCHSSTRATARCPRPLTGVYRAIRAAGSAP